MAWVRQRFEMDGVRVTLDEHDVEIKIQDGPIPVAIVLEPDTQQEAHGYAMLLRRAARRLEEIGRGL